jgi:hypothetical protein
MCLPSLWVTYDILSQVYYRERLLPKRVFNWLEAFYKKTEAEQHQPAPSYPLNPSATGSLNGSRDDDAVGQDGANPDNRLSQDSDYGVGHVAGARTGTGGHLPRGSTHDRASLRASTISSIQGGLHARDALPVVEKEDLGMGIRRIRPLTAVRIAIALTQYCLWTVKRIAVGDFMMCYALLIVFPSFVEVVLEIRNFFAKQRHEAEGGISHSQHGTGEHRH